MGDGGTCNLGKLDSTLGSKEVLVIGHKSPDTDAVVSAIAFTHILREAGIKARPAVAGALQPETRVVLEKVGLSTPEFVEDVRVRAKDVMRVGSLTVRVSEPVKLAVDLMVKNSLTAIPLIDDSLRVHGLFTIDSFARYFLKELASMRLSLESVPLRNFLKVSGSKLIAGSDEGILEGRVYVGAWGKGSEEARVDEVRGQILVVGDREEVQLWGIDSGVSTIIVTGGHGIKPKLLEKARESRVTVISSPHDTYSSLKLLELSQPVEWFATDALRVLESSLLNDVRDELVRAGMRAAVVIDELGRFRGLISRAELVGVKGRPIALVDHNEFSQAVEGVEEAQVVAVVDHHRVGGDVESITPILFRVEPLGSTNTILWRMIKECGTELPPKIAEAMLYAILSDTLLLKSPTTTPIDKEAVRELSEAAGVSIDEVIKFMRIAMAANEPTDPEDIVRRDLKVFDVKGVKFGIAQVLTTRPENYLQINNKIKQAMMEVIKEKKLKFLALMITDSIDSKTYLIIEGDKTIMQKALKTDLTGKPYAELKGITSRKSQLLPKILNQIT